MREWGLARDVPTSTSCPFRKLPRAIYVLRPLSKIKYLGRISYIFFLTEAGTKAIINSLLTLELKKNNYLNIFRAESTNGKLKIFNSCNFSAI